jgi:uncharacterized protein (TIGR00369 family)
VPTTNNTSAVSSDDGTVGTIGPWTSEQLQDRMGIELLEAASDRVVATMPVAGNRQPYGLLHGGANAVLAESAGSIAAAHHAGTGRIAVGVELSCTHHRPATEGSVTAVATPLHLGRNSATYDIAITDEQGRRTCSARLSCALRDSAPG